VDMKIWWRIWDGEGVVCGDMYMCVKSLSCLLVQSHDEMTGERMDMAAVKLSSAISHRIGSSPSACGNYTTAQPRAHVKRSMPQTSTYCSGENLKSRISNV
jgi:hypothetical protein